MTPRPFYWSVRRELWENRAVWIAPLAAAGLVVFAFLVTSWKLPGFVADAALTAGPNKPGGHLYMPYMAAAAAPYMITWLVAIFYSLSALHGERRDRSLLFWKSLPVSDAAAVLAKAAVPMLVQPVVAFAVAIGAQLVLLLLSLLILAASRSDLAVWWAHIHMPATWAVMAFGLVVNALWDAPFYAWFLLVSAWARRLPFVWAVAPWLALWLLEYLVFHTNNVRGLLNSRIFGGFGFAYGASGGGHRDVMAPDLSKLDPGGFLASPGLWVGLVVAALMLAACVWLRRRQDPI